MLTSSLPDSKASVREYWDGNPCGSVHAFGASGSLEWYDAIERRRLELEPFIENYARFKEARDLDVLEIGVGLGTDFIRFARAGARVTGVDLTERGVELADRRLKLEGLHGKVLVADAEALPFGESSFDRVYSWGVMHHTPDTQQAVREAIRVLRPGGELTLMLYGRRSWVAYGLWVRHALLRGRPWRSLADVLANHMESEGTKAYTFRELHELCAGLKGLQLRRLSTPYDRRVGGPLVSLLGDRLGWFIVIHGYVMPDA